MVAASQNRGVMLCGIAMCVLLVVGIAAIIIVFIFYNGINYTGRNFHRVPLGYGYTNIGGGVNTGPSQIG
jgi:hypothetical protein